MAYCLSDASIGDFRGYPFGPFTYTKTQSFQRNNCGGGQEGSSVTYSKNYTSNLSYDHAWFLASQDTSTFNTEGQTYANSNGACITPITYTPFRLVINNAIWSKYNDVAYWTFKFYDSSFNEVDSFRPVVGNIDITYNSVIPTTASYFTFSCTARRYNWFHDLDVLVYHPYHPPTKVVHINYGAGINIWQTKTTSFIPITIVNNEISIRIFVTR